MGKGPAVSGTEIMAGNRMTRQAESSKGNDFTVARLPVKRPTA
jgi:hypothetical protein